jgi:type IV pilus assembly protein PilQ
MKTNCSMSLKVIAPRYVTIGLVVLLAGCATTPEVARRDPLLQEWKQPMPPAAAAKSEAPALARPPALVSKPAQPVIPPRINQERSLPTNMVSDLELTDEAEIATILRSLAKAAEVNVLISPAVEGSMRFSFKNVPWDEAFRSVINSAGLAYAWEGQVLRVMTMEDLKRGVEMETLLKERADVRAEKRRIEPTIIQVIPVKYSKARTVGATLRSLFAMETGENASRSSISVDEENNAIIVHAVPDDVDKAVALIQQIDQAKPQVHIEARIVEAARDTARQLGIQWGAQFAQGQNNRLISAGGANATAGGYNSDFIAQFAQAGLAPVGFNFGLISERIGGSELLSMQLTALQSKGRIQILSSPSITTLDNEAAVIESGEERAYRKTTGTGNDLDVSVEWKKAVLKLEVTPHVVDGDYLRVEIIANKDSFDESKPQSNNEFPVNTKRAKTTVLLRNGETVVIGGLSLESSADTENGIPFLADIPGLGYLFKNKGTARKFDETLIFITPNIITAQRQEP